MGAVPAEGARGLRLRFLLHKTVGRYRRTGLLCRSKLGNALSYKAVISAVPDIPRCRR